MFSKHLNANFVTISYIVLSSCFADLEKYGSSPAKVVKMCFKSAAKVTDGTRTIKLPT